MYKKIILILVFSFFTIFLNLDISYWSSVPEVNCIWLPGCVDNDMKNPGTPNISNNIVAKFTVNLIWEFIQIVAVVAVFALIFSWVMYLISAWEEEKANKAKKWIIWSLVWVFLSISAWGIISFLNIVWIGSF